MSRFHSLRSRLATYPDKHAVSPKECAVSGFVSVEGHQLITCYMCGLTLRISSALDAPFEEHYYHSPECSHLLRVFDSFVHHSARGSLLTCGDVESNPGPVVPITAQVGLPDAAPGTPQRPRRQPRRPRRRSNNQPAATKIPAGTVSQPAAGYIVPYSKRMTQTSRVLNSTQADELPNYVTGFLERHLDPCGEYRTQLDNGKIPDGAVPQSVSGQFREVFTLKHPGASDTSVELTGNTFALVIVHLPLWRTPLLLIAQLVKAEVDDDDVNAVLTSFNNVLDRDYALYPKWVPVSDGLYWSIKQWTAFDSVPPPSDLGVSPFIHSFRVTGDGFEMVHNTPSLIDQGVVVGAQYPGENDLRAVTVAVDNNTTAARLFLEASRTGLTGTVTYSLIGRLPGFGNYPWAFGAALTTTTPPAGSPSVTVVQNIGVVQYDVTLGNGNSYSAGDDIEAYLTIGAVGAGEVGVRVVGSTTALFALFFSNQAASDRSSAFTNATVSEVVGGSTRVNALTLPPVRQEDHIQETPKAVQLLLKDHQGMYMPKRKFQPVFSFTKASDYGPVRFLTRSTGPLELELAVGDIRDTVDVNYGYGVMSFTSLPYACQPYMKMVRSWEALPSKGSPWGPFTTYTTPRDDIFMDIIDAFQDQDPFAYPAKYNGFGLMFAKILKVVRKIPNVIRTGRNVAKVVSECVSDAQAIVETGMRVRDRFRTMERV